LQACSEICLEQSGRLRTGRDTLDLGKFLSFSLAQRFRDEPPIGPRLMSALLLSIARAYHRLRSKGMSFCALSPAKHDVGQPRAMFSWRLGTARGRGIEGTRRAKTGRASAPPCTLEYGLGSGGRPQGKWRPRCCAKHLALAVARGMICDITQQGRFRMWTAAP